MRVDEQATNLPNEHISSSAQVAVTQLFQHKDVKDQLEQHFRSMDYANKGAVAKDDFINCLFEVAKDCLQPAQTMSIVQQFATGDEVNY